MKLKYYAFLFTLLAPTSSAFGQRTFTISGYIEDAKSSEKLISAALVDGKSKAGVVSNTYGFYSLTLPAGNVELVASYVGYKQQNFNFKLRRDTIITIKLAEADDIQTVEISAKKQNRIESRVQMSQVVVPIEQIKRIPALLGEVDVLKALQLLPGVQGGTEGTNGLYVRGGSPDQNLILLDGTPVYNVSHLGGFFSVFNGDAVKNVTLTKGGFPARYGGRLSSIIEIDMKEGNMKEFHGEGGIGVVASRLTLEGPLVKDKVSFMVSARRTYLDAIIKPFLPTNAATTNRGGGGPGGGGGTGAAATQSVDLALYFYDLNAKINWKINDNHRLFLSAYKGLDIFRNGIKNTETATGNYSNTSNGINWGNLTTNFRWNWLISNKIFANTTVTSSRYGFSTSFVSEAKRDTSITSRSAKYDSGIKDYGIRTDFDYVVNPKNRIRFGAGTTQHVYTPGVLQFELQDRLGTLDTTVGSVTVKSLESYVYVEDELNLGALKLNGGLHASTFNVEGKTYSSVQPRLSANYLLKNDWAIKASYAKMQQYINLLTNENIGLPTDLWVPSTARIAPQESQQIALGTAKTIKEEYEFSVEAYYKQMTNVISYREGANFLGVQSAWEDKIVQGKGKAYGLEFFVQKKEGKTTGWIGYTLSWNFRQFDAINSGIEYPFKYDRRHDISVVVSHEFSKTFSLTGSWLFGTGNSITLATNDFPLITRNNTNINRDPRQLVEVSTVGEKNAFRMPAYHRLDVNFEFIKKKKRFTRKWSVGAYNAYSRANPFYIIRDEIQITKPDGSQGTQPVFRQVSLFPIIPSITYGFKF
jgi:TonB-dependent Receptor Plug Domain/CarboxypepD_reg-like domain